MDTPNFPHSFITDFEAYFSKHAWGTNIVKNLVSFRGIAHSTLTFIQGSEISMVFDGTVVVTFFLP